jgi:hypothetical protein
MNLKWYIIKLVTSHWEFITQTLPSTNYPQNHTTNLPGNHCHHKWWSHLLIIIWSGNVSTRHLGKRTLWWLGSFPEWLHRFCVCPSLLSGLRELKTSVVFWNEEPTKVHLKWSIRRPCQGPEMFLWEPSDREMWTCHGHSGQDQKSQR